MNFKKTILIISIIVILAIGGFFAYKYFFKTETPATEEGETIVIGGEEGTAVSQANLLSQEQVLSPVLDGTVKYYSASNGNVFQVNPDGTNSNRISASILTDLIRVSWSPDKTKIISFFDQVGEVQKYFYDFIEDESVLLNANIQSLDWSPAGDQIVYHYHDPLSGFDNISIANPDGSEWKNIFQTRMEDIIVEWPNQIIIRTKPSGLIPSAVYAIDTAGNNFRKIIDDTYGLTTLWSPQGTKVLYSETGSQGQNLKLKLLNIGTDTTITLNFVTLPEKCVWSDETTIYCAVPTIIPDVAVLPDDYYKNLLEFSDVFYKIDLNTGQKLLLGKLNANADNLLVNDSYLIFVNRRDGRLYSLTL